MSRTSNTPRRPPMGAPIVNYLFTWPAGVTIPANGAVDRNFAVPEALVGDCPVVAPDPGFLGIMYLPRRVTVAGTVTVCAFNCTGTGPVDVNEQAFELRIV